MSSVFAVSYSANISKLNLLIREVEEDSNLPERLELGSLGGSILDSDYVEQRCPRIEAIRIRYLSASKPYMQALDPVRLVALKSAVGYLEERDAEEAARTLRCVVDLIEPFLIIKRILKLSNSQDTISWIMNYASNCNDIELANAIYQRIARSSKL